MSAKKKIFIYDTTGSLVRLLQLYFSDEYHLTICRKSTDVMGYHLSGYHAAFVVLSDDLDLIHLYNIKLSVANVFVSSDKARYNQYFAKTEGMVVLDFLTTKNGMVEKIRTNLKWFEMNGDPDQ